MIITKIELRIKNTPRLKAVACLHVEDKYILNDVKLILCNDGNLRAEFPKAVDGRFAFLPTTKEARAEIEKIIIDEYLKKSGSTSAFVRHL